MLTNNIKEFNIKDWDGTLTRVLYAWDDGTTDTEPLTTPRGTPYDMFIEGYSNGKWLLVEGSKHVHRDHVAIAKDNMPSRMTNLQLAYWLKSGNRQVLTAGGRAVIESYPYTESTDNDLVPANVRVRAILNDAQGIRATEWIIPTVDLLNPVPIDSDD